MLSEDEERPAIEVTLGADYRHEGKLSYRDHLYRLIT
jgi:hypothetical protein